MTFILSFYLPFLWVCGFLLAAFCLWSRLMPPTSWSGLEDAEGPEKEGKRGGDIAGEEGERDRERHRYISEVCDRSAASSPAVMGGEHDVCMQQTGLAWSLVLMTTLNISGWARWYLILQTHTFMCGRLNDSSQQTSQPSKSIFRDVRVRSAASVSPAHCWLATN